VCQPHEVDHRDLWPVTTLADGTKVLKFCELSCCRTYRADQAKLPGNQRDSDVGEIICTRCGEDLTAVDRKPTVNHGLQGERDKFCSVACVSQLALVYAARDRAALGVLNRSLNARRRTDLPEPKDAVDLKAKYEKDKHANLLSGPGQATIWELLMPTQDSLFEWRVELDCGCVHQAVTATIRRFPRSCSPPRRATYI
jgi:hypothetical protein